MAQATREHRELAQFLKDVHSELRKISSTLGVQAAWSLHCANQKVLNKYAECMQKLATTYWEDSSSSHSNPATSRIQWVVDFTHFYFHNKNYLIYQEKEIEICKKINLTIGKLDAFAEKLNLLDVGSCYNPFQSYKCFEVVAIDLCPANGTVYKCDFTDILIGSTIVISNNIQVMQLQQDYFDVVTFCFLLEYIPCPRLRLKACENAYKVLKPGGLLLISTPDSKHVGANSRIMKCWRYTFACMGFSRIKYEKHKHMHCMAFRKSIRKDTAVRWAELHKEPYMSYVINIPQDFSFENDSVKDSNSFNKNEMSDLNAFSELPFNSTLG